MAHYDDLYDEVDCGYCGESIYMCGKDSVNIGAGNERFSPYIKKDTGYCCEKCMFEMLEKTLRICHINVMIL